MGGPIPERLPPAAWPPRPDPNWRAKLVAACPCEEHEYCDEACRCSGVIALAPLLP